MSKQIETRKRDKSGHFLPKSKAAKIRELAAKGLNRSAIAEQVGVSYQMVRLTLLREVKMGRMTEDTFNETQSGRCTELCQGSQSDTCTCICQGANHGAQLGAARGEIKFKVRMGKGGIQELVELDEPTEEDHTAETNAEQAAEDALFELEPIVGAEFIGTVDEFLSEVVGA